MKKLFLPLCALFSFAVGSHALAQDVAIRVLGPQGKLLLELTTSVTPSQTLGQLTHSLLEEATAQGRLQQYLGSDAGVQSVNYLGSELEVLSDTEMNAYGWCYKVDGVVSSLLAHQYVLTEKTAHIEWFYAYAHLDKSDWTSMCVPADHKPESQPMESGNTIQNSSL